MSRVRPATVSDARAIARVHSDSWRLAYAGLLSPRYLAGLDAEDLTDSWRRRLVRLGGGGRIIVAEQADQVVGFARYAPCTGDDDLNGFAGEIEMLYVHPGAQRRGHGQALFASAASALASRPLFWLVVWVVAGNRGARVFYHRMGLRPDGARRVDRLAGERVAVVRYAGALNPLDWEPPASVT